ncbi:MAG: hemerythrin domain-containing protein [Vicinamibacteria bacterium]|jgi:hemerythrin-like domain-containing protein|nr:hemerythrin domain-containing protein [Vicinamibacteria bacterium]
MDPARFEEARCHHSEVLAAIEALEAAVRGARPLQVAVADYLAFHRGHLVPLMRQEEAWLVPLIAQHLPSEVMPPSLLRREHETIDLLASALEEGLRHSGPDVDAELFPAASDMCLLVRDHIRREDAVLRPLLERLAEATGEM